MFYKFFYLINIILILFLITISIYVLNKHKFNLGDPIISPPLKKTYYCNDKIISNYDYTPFFNKIKKSILNDKSISHYEWCFYVDSEVEIIHKAVLTCVYKIGIRKIALIFNINNIFYKDKLGVLHLQADLIECRRQENLLSKKILQKTLNNTNTDNLWTEIFINGQIEGYNITTGDIHYKIVLEEWQNKELLKKNPFYKKKK